MPFFHGFASAIQGKTMKSERELLDQIESLTDEVEALISLAESEERDLNDEERARCDAIMDDGGELTKAKAELAQVHKYNAIKSQIALARKAQKASQQPFAGVTIEGNGNTPQPNVVHNRIGKLEAFAGKEQDAWNCGQWFKAVLAYDKGHRDEKAEAYCSRIGWDIQATATEASPSGGGYLVPTPLSNAIVDIRDTFGVARRLADVMPMTADTLSVPKLTAGPTVYYPGEAGAITASDNTWGQFTLNAKKRAILSYVSQELSDDAIISIMDHMATRQGYELAGKEDDEYVNGDASSTYGGVTGLKNAIGSAGVATSDTGDSTWDTLDMDDFTAVLGKLDSKYWGPGVSWLCSANFYHGCMLRVLAEAGGNTVSSLEAGATAMPTFLGYPVYFSSKCATATAVSTIFAYFGNFMVGTTIGDRSGVRIAVSDQYAFNQDLTAIRATTRYDINCHEVGDSSNAGAVVALKTAAS